MSFQHRGLIEVSTTAAALGKPLAMPDGNIYFVRDFDVVTKLDISNGTLTDYTFVPTGSGLTQGSELTLDGDGNIWGYDYAGNYVIKITPTGTFTEYATPSTPGRLTLGPDGNLWFVEQSAAKLCKVTTGGVVTEYAITAGHTPVASVAVNGDGKIWLATMDGGAILHIKSYNTSGVQQTTASTGQAFLAGGIYGGTNSIFWIPSAVANSTVWRVQTDGTRLSTTLPVSSGVGTILSLEPVNDGMMIVGSALDNGAGYSTVIKVGHNNELLYAEDYRPLGYDWAAVIGFSPIFLTFNPVDNLYYGTTANVTPLHLFIFEDINQPRILESDQIPFLRRQ